MITHFDETLLQNLNDFIEYYEFTDVEKVYTNGSKLIQVSRIKQWFDYKNKQKELDENNLQQRIDKAIEYIESYNLPEDLGSLSECPISVGELEELLKILKGEEK